MARKSARCGTDARSPRPHQPRPGTTDRAAEPWLPARRDGRPGEGQRLTADTPHNGGRPASPGRPPTNPAARSPSEGMQTKWTVLGPHTRTAGPTARGWQTPTARPEDGQPGEGERLNSDAPHNSERHPSGGLPPATPTARNDGSQVPTLWDRCWVPTPTPTVPVNHRRGRRTLAARPKGRAAGGGTAPDTRHPSQRCKATPPRDSLPPPLRHAPPRRA